MFYYFAICFFIEIEVKIILYLYKLYNMQTATISKSISEDKDLMQQEVSAHIAICNNNYNTLKNGNKDLALEQPQKFSILFKTNTHEILNYRNIVPTAIKVVGKPDCEKLHLRHQLQAADKTMVYKIIDTILTKQKFQNFFEQNLQTAKY